MKDDDLHNAFSQLYVTHSDQIFRFCITKVRDRALALDITQDTFIRLWKYIEKKENLDQPKALLYKIAYTQIVDWSRKNRTLSLDAIIETGKDFSHIETYTEGVAHNDFKNILSALDTLSDEYRIPLTMRYLDGMSVKEIADVLEQKPNIISVRLHRGLEKIRNKLSS